LGGRRGPLNGVCLGLREGNLKTTIFPHFWAWGLSAFYKRYLFLQGLTGERLLIFFQGLKSQWGLKKGQPTF
jgi:hypothetical protein